MSEAIYLDPKEFYSVQLDGWEDLWNTDKTLFFNIENILSQMLVIPRKDLVIPIATAYMLIPSKWSFRCGVLFSWGDEGSGKSTIAKLANRIHGHTTLQTPASTFSSVRNELDNLRWIDKTEKECEKEGAILCWDNLHQSTLEMDNKLYQLLLFGYDRNTDKITIASGGGENKEYNVYCPKIISSINPLHTIPAFSELQRRLILIPHKRFDKFSAEEKAEYKDYDFSTDLLEFESISWEGIEDNFYLFWNKPDVCKDYVAYRKLLTKKGKKPFIMPDSITPHNWAISVDLIVTGILAGGWKDIQTAIDFVGEYWKYINENYFNDFTATLAHLRDFIMREAGVQLEINEKRLEMGEKPVMVIVCPKRLKAHLQLLQNEGKLDITPKNKDVNELMWKLGWKLTTLGWVQR